MRLKDIFQFRGKITPAQRKAGILMKAMSVFMPAGFWVCAVEVNKVKRDKHQRPVTNSHVRKIIERFNPLYVSMPLCTCRSDGVYPGMTVYVEDGSHTVDVLVKGNRIIRLDDGREVIVCLVNFDMTKEEAAKFFAVKNGSRRNVGAWKKFEAAWIGNSPAECCLMTTASRVGLTTPLEPLEVDGKKIPADLNHPSEYVKIYESHGPRFVHRLFKLHVRYFKGQEYPRQFLQGLVRVINTYKPTDTQLAVALSSAKIVEKVMARAGAIQQEEGAARADVRYVVKALEARLVKAGLRMAALCAAA